VTEGNNWVEVGGVFAGRRRLWWRDLVEVYG